MAQVTMPFDGRVIAGITVFVAVAKAGSYARAAEHIGLSRSGIGKAIARLEDRIGMKLFDRNSRTLKLTDQGRLFLEEVTPLIDELGRIATPSTPQAIRGRLRVTTDAAFGPFLLIPALPRFLAAYPNVKIDVVVRDRIENLASEGMDVAIRFGEPESRGLNKHLLMRNRVVTCASRSYIAQHGSPSTPQDLLSNHRCVRMLDDITGKPHNWNFTDVDGNTSTITPDCGLTLNDAPSLLAAALGGYGVVRLLDFVAEGYLREGWLVEVLPDWNHLLWPAYLYTAADAHPSHAVSAFCEFALSLGMDKRCEDLCDPRKPASNQS